eukprot:199068-Chlamydomonas_euryale.AAC.2
MDSGCMGHSIAVVAAHTVTTWWYGQGLYGAAVTWGRGCMDSGCMGQRLHGAGVVWTAAAAANER